MATVAGPGPQPHAVDTHTHEDTHANEANETQGSGTGAPAPEGANPPAAASGSFFSSLSSCCPEQATETDPEDSWGVFFFNPALCDICFWRTASLLDIRC